MDGRYLSDKAVVEASRGLVCVRLATYESADEAQLLSSIFLGRSGALENTTFTILAPDGVTKLARPGRSPDFAYGRGPDAARRMAADLKRIARRYPGRRAAGGAAPLPQVADVRLGLDVAACDQRPLVIVFGRDRTQQRSLEKTLAALAWSPAFVGRLLYVSTRDAKDLSSVAKAQARPGFLVVGPGRFGLRGTTLAQVPAGATGKILAAALERGLAAWHPVAGNLREHVREGRREGVHWKTAIPVTDPGRPPPGHGGPPPGR
jgi:hypothetical protein